MKVFFLMEDHYGKPFIKKFIQAKQQDGLFVNVIADAKQVPLGSLGNEISNRLQYNDRIVVMVDADGSAIDNKRNHVKNFIRHPNPDSIKIVVFKNEIEDWICYSNGIDPGDKKPSNILKHEQKYEKYRLPNFASKIDCSKLAQCMSFQELKSALE